MAVTTKDQSVEEKLKALFDLQHIHSKLMEIAVLKGELPIEVKDLEDELEGLGTRLTKLEEELAEKEESIVKYKAKIKDSEAAIKKYDKQKNQVKNNREFEALSKETEMQKLEIELLEKRIREALEDIESRKAYLKESSDLMAVKKKELNLKMKELEKIIDETEKEEKKLLTRATKDESSVEPRLLGAFKRIVTTYKNGLAVVKYDRDSCGGCFAKIPPQKQMEIRQRKKIMVCEHCGRILVDPDIDAS